MTPCDKDGCAAMADVSLCGKHYDDAIDEAEKRGYAQANEDYEHRDQN